MEFATLSPAMAHASNYGAWICHTFQPYMGKRLLEVGLGYDTIRPHCPAMDIYWSVDIDPAAVTLARQRFPQGIHLQGDILAANFNTLFRENGPDTVLCVNVLEHIQDDGHALTNLLSVLSPGGHLLILVPAFPALYGPMDRLAGHHRRYRKQDLRQALSSMPGRICRLDYFNGIGGVGWWLNRWAKPSSLADNALQSQIKLFDRYGVPLSRWLDPVTRGFFGQSLVCVFEKGSRS